MKSMIITICGALIFLSSCSVYRSGQTPDDVYYSPVREEGVIASSARERNNDDYVQGRSSRDAGRRYQQDRPTYSGYDDYATMDDRWLMMRARNPNRWSYFDDYSLYGGFSPFYNPWSMNSWNMGYGYGGLGFGFNYGFYNPYSFGFNNFYNSYWNWNSFYNPYYPYHPGVVVIGGGGKTNPDGYTKARMFNTNNYLNNTYNNNRSVVPGRRPQYGLGPTYNNSNSQGGRRVFQNNNRTDNSNYSAPSRNYNNDRPSRTYNPSYNNTPSYNNSSPSYSPSRGSSGGGYNGGGGSGGGSGSRPSRR